MKTANLNISLPVWMKAQIEKAATDLGFANTSEYVRSLFRDAQARRRKDDFDHSLLQAMNEPAKPFTEADWEELERPLRETHPELFKV